MGLILAIASGIVICVTFVLDYAFKLVAKNARKEPPEGSTFEENDAVTKHNIDVVTLRNTRQARLALFSFLAIATIQIFNILRTQDSMNETQKNDARLTTIERYLWGDQGGPGPDMPPIDPNGLDGFLRKLDAKIEGVCKNLDAMSRRQAQLSTKMIADIQKLKTVVRPAKKLALRKREPHRLLRHSAREAGKHMAMR